MAAQARQPADGARSEIGNRLAGAGSAPFPVARRVMPWRGRSGRLYALEEESLERFALEGDALYVLARGDRVLWVGSNADLIAEPASRACFRLALARADSAGRLSGPFEAADRLAMIWDMEGAAPDAAPAAA